VPAATDAVWLDVLPSMRGFGPALAAGAQSEADKVGKTTGSRFGKAMLAGVAVVGVGAALAAKALYSIGSTFDDVTDTIRTGTGATGKALEALTQSAKNVGRNVPASFEDVGTAIADVNTRLGLTGKPLEDLSAQFLELSRITGTDVATNIEQVSRVFGDWGVATEDQSGALDYLFKVSQSTGIGLDQLSTKVVQYGAPMRQFGFSFEESAALMGKWAKEGVNTETIMGGLRAGLGKLAKAGKDPAAAFQEITERIKNAGSEGEATAIAIETFGQRAGPDLAAAVREGRFELDDLMGTLDASGETIMGAGKDTQDFAEQWQMFKNRVLVVVEPIASRVFSALGTGMEWLSEAAGRFVAAWQSGNAAGMIERLGVVARQVFDYLKNTAVPALRDVGGWIARNREWLLPLVAGIAAATVAWKTYIAVTRGIVAFKKAWAAAQIALNVALRANPIGIIITVLAAFAAAIAVAWNRSETFRDVVKQVWSAVLGFFKGAWDYIKGFFSWLGGFFTGTLPGWWNSFLGVVKTAWNAITTATGALWNALKAYFTFVINLWKAVGTAIFNVWRTIIKAAWDAVQAAARFLWNNILKPIFDAISRAWDALGRAIRWVYDRVIKPAWNAVRDGVSWLWNTILKPIFSAISSAWDTMGRAFKTVYNNIIAPLFRAFVEAGTWIKNRFSDAIDGIADLWGGLKDLLKKPIQAVIDVVWNNGIRKLWNTVNNLWGGENLDTFRLARGGVLPGYTPGRDVHTFLSPTGGRLDLSGGEAVMRPEWTRVMGRANVDLLNQIARQEGEAGLRRALAGGMTPDMHQHFAAGGTVRLGNRDTSWAESFGSWAVQFAPGGNALKVLADYVRGERDAFAGGGGNGWVGDAVRSTLGNAANRLWRFIKGKVTGLFGDDPGERVGGGGSLGPPGGGGGLGSTWHSIWNVVKAQLPAARINSTYRPGDPGYHGRNKAIDFGYGTGPGGAGSLGLAAIASFLYRNYGSRLAELIYTGRYDTTPDVKNSRNHVYSPFVKATHMNHVHAAVYDRGGWLQPGYTLAYNGTGKPERVVTGDQNRPVIFNIYGVDFASRSDKRRVAAEIRRELIGLDREQW
jgi:phage-related minor tail protein